MKMAAPTSNLSTWEAEAKGLLQSQGQPTLSNEFKASQGSHPETLSQTGRQGNGA